MTHSELIDHLSKLDTPDREVDAELEAVSLGGRVYLNDPESKEVIIERPIDGFWIRGIYPYRKIARYTASVDAAMALAERVLPGWWIQHMGQCTSGWKVRIETQGKSIPEGMKFDYAPSPAIALLIALLRAKEASNG